MYISKPVKIVIACIAALLLIVAIILVVVTGDKDKAQPTGGDSTVPATANGYDVTGSWYSDREGGDTLTLDPTGSYTSSNWLVNGKYTIAGDTVSLTDIFGDSKKLIIAATGDTYIMRYDGSATHTYHRTEQGATAAREQKKAEEEEKQSFYDAALMQILTTGEWISIDESTTLQFTESTITISYAGTTNIEAATVNYSYVITSFEVAYGNYSVKMDLHDETSNLDFKNSGAGITVSDDNTYTITCGNLPYAQKYKKTVEIVFEQPQANTGSVTASDINDANSTEDAARSDAVPTTGDRTVINADGSIDRITQLSRDDNPDDSEHRAKTAALVEAEIYGTWKGTFEEMPKENAVYWTFTFNADGTYMFSDGSITETGTFTLTHINDNLYHSTLNLVTKDGTAEEHRFYLSVSSTIKMKVEGITHPTYTKQ